MNELDRMLSRLRENSKDSIGNDSTENDCECPKCHGTGRYLYTKDGKDYARECECGILQREIMNSRLRFANIPNGFKEVRLTDISEKVYREPDSVKLIQNAKKIVNTFLEHFDAMRDAGMGLYFYSEKKGSGKTKMAIALANELIYEKHIQVKFATSMQILNEIKASWNRESDYSESELLNQLSATDVLVIDDFGTEQARDWISEKFYSIINNRYIGKKITIVTSNYPLSGIPYDERITNRIKERVFIVPFPEESVRDKIAIDNLGKLEKMLNG